MPKSEVPEEVQRLRDGIGRVRDPLLKLVLLTSRLGGIVSRVGEDKAAKKTLHRAQTIVGYRRQIVKKAGALYAAIAELEETLSAVG